MSAALRRGLAREPGACALAALAAAAWLLIALARASVFGLWWLALPLLAGAAALGGYAWWHSARADKIATAALVALAALLYLPPAQTLALTGDAAIYANEGAYLARTGGLRGAYAPLAALSPATRDLFYIASEEQFGGTLAATAYDGLVYGGYYVVDDGPPTLRAARMPQMEAWLGLLYALAGGTAGGGAVTLPFFLNPAAGALALCLLYAVGRRLCAPWIAFWAAALIGVSYPQVYLARAPLAEIVGQVWTLAGLLLALRWLEARRPWQLVAALLLWATAWSARIDALLLLGPAALLLMWAAARRDWAALRAALLCAPLVAALAVLGANPPYIFATAELATRMIAALGPGLLGAAVALALMLLAAWLAGPWLLARAWPRLRLPLNWLLFAAAAFVVLWATLPTPWRDANITRHFQEIPWFASLYLSPLLFWLALAGVGLLLWQGYSAAEGFVLLMALGLGAAYFFTYTSAPVYPISLRRLAPDVLPLLALLAGMALDRAARIRWLHAPSRHVAVQAFAAAAVLVAVALRTGPLLTQHEARDEAAFVASLHAHITADAALIFEPQDADSYVGWLAAPLYSLYGDWALLLETDTPDSATLAQALDELRAAGRTPYLVSQSSPAPAALAPPGYVAVPVYETTWASALIGQTRTPYPPPYWEYALPLRIFRLDPVAGSGENPR